MESPLDPAASLFLEAFLAYAGELETFLSNPAKNPEVLLKLAASTNALYSLPYYAANAARLQPVVIQVLASGDLQPLVRAVGIDNPASGG